MHITPHTLWVTHSQDHICKRRLTACNFSLSQYYIHQFQIRYKDLDKSFPSDVSFMKTFDAVSGSCNLLCYIMICLSWVSSLMYHQLVLICGRKVVHPIFFQSPMDRNLKTFCFNFSPKHLTISFQLLSSHSSPPRKIAKDTLTT